MRPIAARAEIVAVSTRVVRSHRKSPRHSPRNGFNGFLRALLGDRAFLPPSPALPSANLTPASGRQDHTTSPSASRARVRSTISVHRIPPRVDDVAQRPSWRDGTARVIEVICVFGKSEYFCKSLWTQHNSASAAICPSGAVSSSKPVGCVEPTGRANARPMINSAIPITPSGASKRTWVRSWGQSGLYVLAASISPFDPDCVKTPTML